MPIVFIVGLLILPSVCHAEDAPPDIAEDETVSDSDFAKEAPGGEAEKPWWENMQKKDAPSPSPCAHVTCSYRGRCLVVEGVPKCACSTGYMTPNNNPLSCVPMRSTMQQRQAESAYVNGSMNGDSDFELETALGGFDVHHAKGLYRLAREEDGYKGSFLEYLERDFERDKIAGILGAGVGMLAILGAVGFYVPAQSEKDGDSRTGMIAAGTGLEIIGVVFLISGAVVAAIASKRLKRLERYRRRSARASSGFGPDWEAGASGSVLQVRF